ncbi:meiosis-specific protein MEI4 isoform X2 [Phyllopteryx taeniolatus]|uniref:meiosis-specific protein MEI4 isoform X2 n=1 Tax=Phyllopteryx taeniolatus TaxID=161469 RepID=UPI002AD42717|nr:meiosis-specific protein MEI4 isoform X2 [Phyllopteryx taeniolatus]
MKYLRLRNLLLLLHCSGGEAFGTMCCDGCVCPECFGAKVSVAVAMSVIRRRPAGVGVGRHVHTLAARLTEGEQTWRSKAELLQQEVLGLRQALLVATATATESTGPDVTTESDSDTPELLQLVPAQQQQLPSNRQQAAQRRAELPHEHFLHSCCAFQRADPPWLGPGRDTDTAEVSADAPCRLLDTLAATFRERSLVGGAGRLALKACRASARAMDLFSSRGAPSARLTTRLQASLRELAAILLHASRQPTVDVSASCLAALGRSRMAKPFLVGHILSEVSVLADALCRAVQLFSAIKWYCARKATCGDGLQRWRSRLQFWLQSRKTHILMHRWTLKAVFAAILEDGFTRTSPLPRSCIRVRGERERGQDSRGRVPQRVAPADDSGGAAERLAGVAAEVGADGEPAVLGTTNVDSLAGISALCRQRVEGGRARRDNRRSIFCSKRLVRSTRFRKANVDVNWPSVTTRMKNKDFGFSSPHTRQC